MKDLLTYSASDTFNVGYRIGQQLKRDSVVCLFGDLGAGKTTLIKGLASGLLGTSGEEVNSPTFTYLNIYSSPKHPSIEKPTTLYHFDLYRLRDEDEFLSMGFDEMFDAGGVCCIEWSERIAKLLPPDVMRITIEHQGGDERRLRLQLPNDNDSVGSNHGLKEGFDEISV